jgi:hypothetical protein
MLKKERSVTTEAVLLPTSSPGLNPHHLLPAYPIAGSPAPHFTAIHLPDSDFGKQKSNASPQPQSQGESNCFSQSSGNFHRPISRVTNGHYALPYH